MDLGRAFSYVFQDPQWVKKALIALVMLVIPIVGWVILYGYMLRIMRQTALGADLPLPEWDDFGGDFLRGLKGFILQLLWNSPVLILSLCTLALSTITSSSLAIQFAGDSSASNTPLVTIPQIWSLCANCLSSVLSTFIAFIAPLFVTRFAVTERFSAALQLPEIFGEISRSGIQLFIVFIASLVLGIIALFGVVLCIVGIFGTLLYTLFVQAHLYGQVRRRLAAGGESAAAPSPVMPTA
jgi:hypothetical protein|uniref:DUF4013 domain-containing protein n=1 Tax=Thermomicrobium roseum TaxID=500 RepID=A0A7C1XNB8_THERO